MVAVDRRFGRTEVLRALVVVGWVCVLCAKPAMASGPDDNLLDPAALLKLEQQAAKAQPREQCILYTQVVHNLTEVAGKQLEDGQEEQAASTLQHIEAISKKMEQVLLKDAKQLKNAELLMEHTTRRLKDMMHLASGDNRPKLQATLERLKVEQAAMLNEVFSE